MYDSVYNTPVQRVVGILSIESIVLGAFYATETECIHSHDEQQNDRIGISLIFLLFMWELDLWISNGPGGKERVFSLSGHLGYHSSITVGGLILISNNSSLSVPITDLWLALFKAFLKCMDPILKKLGGSLKKWIKHKLKLNSWKPGVLWNTKYNKDIGLWSSWRHFIK